MFSIKQFVLDMSAEARKELRELLDAIEASQPKEVAAAIPAPEAEKSKE